jgi:DNA-binding HxlR family transcriptional regulator
MTRVLPKRFLCPTEFAIEVLGGKWKTVLLGCLKERPLRYGELRRILPNLSDKVLSERLRELEDDGLIIRAVDKAAPYRLSPRGETLGGVLTALYDWGVEHADDFSVVCERPLDALQDD